ncbi:MAG: S4 domain-containing protein, partial [Burkholderiales bacterium]
MRLDQALQQRGLVASRSAASRLIQAGAVSVDGKPATKASV